MAWIIFLVVAVPICAVLVWMLVDEAFVRVEPGELGLVVMRGKATDTALAPGPHFVPRLRRMAVEVYPSLELSFRAGDAEVPPVSGDGPEIEHSGPALRASLGDRTTLEVSYTVRFKLGPNALKQIHQRFGTEGLWSAVRDNSARSIRASLSDPGVGIDDLFGASRGDLESKLAKGLEASLADDGFELMLFALGDIELGRTGDVIQATARARLEREREQAEAATRLAEVETDVSLAPHLTDALANSQVQQSLDAALRYRELGVWRDLVNTPSVSIMLSPSSRRGTPANALATDPALSDETVASPAHPDEP